MRHPTYDPSYHKRTLYDGAICRSLLVLKDTKQFNGRHDHLIQHSAAEDPFFNWVLSFIVCNIGGRSQCSIACRKVHLEDGKIINALSTHFSYGYIASDCLVDIQILLAYTNMKHVFFYIQ